MPEPRPVVAVHLFPLYQAVCHSCGWESLPQDRVAEADQLADQHQAVCTMEWQE